MEREMPGRLSESCVAQYARDGYYAPITALDTEDAASVRRALEDCEAQHAERLKVVTLFKGHLLFQWLADLVRAPRLVDTVEDLIGPNILCWTSQWRISEPSSAPLDAWHRDGLYAGIDSDNVVSAWVALSPATVESGCVRCIPGSHREPEPPRGGSGHDDGLPAHGSAIGTTVDEDRAVDIELGAGEAAVFAQGIVHASHPNLSDDRQIAVAIRYLPTNARQMLAEWDSATLVRGKDTHRRFEHEPMPAFDFDPAAVAFHRYAEEQHHLILDEGARAAGHRR